MSRATWLGQITLNNAYPLEQNEVSFPFYSSPQCTVLKLTRVEGKQYPLLYRQYNLCASECQRGGGAHPKSTRWVRDAGDRTISATFLITHDPLYFTTPSEHSQSRDRLDSLRSHEDKGPDLMLINTMDFLRSVLLGLKPS